MGPELVKESAASPPGSEPTDPSVEVEEAVETIGENGVLEESVAEVANEITTDDKTTDEIANTTKSANATEVIDTEIKPQTLEVEVEVDISTMPIEAEKSSENKIEDKVSSKDDDSESITLLLPESSENVTDESPEENVSSEPKEVNIAAESTEEVVASESVGDTFAADSSKEDVVSAKPETEIALEQAISVEVNGEPANIVNQAAELDEVPIKESETAEEFNKQITEEVVEKKSVIIEDTTEVEIIPEQVEEPDLAEVVQEKDIEAVPEPATEVIEVVPETATEPLFSTEVIPEPTKDTPLVEVVQEKEITADIEDQVNAEVKDIKMEIEAVKSLVQKSEPPPVVAKAKDKIADPIEVVEGNTMGTKSFTIQINDDLPITGIIILGIFAIIVG